MREPTADSGMASADVESQGDWAEDHRKPTSWRHAVENYLRIAGDRSDFGAPDTWLMSVVGGHI